MASAYALPTNSLALTENDHDHRHSRNASRSSNASTTDSNLKRTTTNGSMQPPSISFHDTNGRPVSLYSANDFYSIKSQSTTSLAPTSAPGAREGLGLRIDDGMTLKSEAYPSIRTPIGGEPIEQSTGHEILSFLLFPLPLLVASIGFASRSYDLAKPDRADIGYTQLRKQVLDNVPSASASSARVASGLMEVLTLTSATLMLLGLINKIQALSQIPLSRNHASGSTFLNQIKDISIVNVIQDVGLRVAGIALPYFATMTLGGQRSSHIILSAIVLCSFPQRAQTDSKSAFEPWRGLVKAKAFLAAVLVLICADFAGYGASLSQVDLVFGYSSLLLAISLLLTTPNTFVQPWSNEPQTVRTPAVRTPVSPPSSWKNGSETTSDKSADDNILLLSGTVLFAATIAIAYISDQSPPLSLTWLICSTLAVAFAILVAKFVRPSYLTHSRPLGYAVSSTFIAIFNAISSSTSISRQLVNFAIITLTATAVLLECSASRPKDANPFAKRRHAHHKPGQFSHFTTLILAYCEPDSLLYSIISEKDSRRIAYFTCLNFAFMFVQGLYGYLSGSLGLLSDTVHMFFDCLGLVVGLGAAVASKWPSSPERPFGWEKLNTLAGFGNGVFLMLVSVEFVWEAIEGMLEGRELRRVKELFVVSTLGMIVNLIGLLAFGHAHAGHDHGHGHSHGSSHQHDHHDHHHHNENMHGIFLHVAADAGGSLAVIISTALTLWYPWYLWDPLATIIIAILIFAAAVPLVVSSGQKLLLIVPEETEYGIKNFLQEVGQVRGVIGYAVPRFWMIEAGNEDAHKHEHGHEHAHNHGHSHATETHHAHHHNRDESGHHQHDHDGHHSAEQHGHNHDHDHHDHHGHDHDHNHNHDHAHEHKTSHDHDHSHESKPHSHDARSKEHVHEECCHGSSRLTGSLHVIAAPFADLEDIRERVEELAITRKMKILVHVEYESDSHCWCGGSQKS